MVLKGSSRPDTQGRVQKSILIRNIKQTDGGGAATGNKHTPKQLNRPQSAAVFQSAKKINKPSYDPLSDLYQNDKKRLKSSASQLSFLKNPFIDQKSPAIKQSTLDNSLEKQKHKPIISLNAKYIQQTNWNNQKQQLMVTNNHLLKTLPLKATQLQQQNYMQQDLMSEKRSVHYLLQNNQNYMKSSITQYNKDILKHSTGQKDSIMNSMSLMSTTKQTNLIRNDMNSRDHFNGGGVNSVISDIKSIQPSETPRKPMKFLEIPDKKQNKIRPMTGLRQSHSQPRLLSADPRLKKESFVLTGSTQQPTYVQHYDQISKGQQAVTKSSLPSNFSQTQQNFQVRNVYASQSQLRRPLTASMQPSQRNRNRSSSDNSIPRRFRRNTRSRQQYYEESIFDNNNLMGNSQTGQSQAVILSLDDLPVPQRAKLQNLARKSVHQFVIDRDGDETTKINMFSFNQIRRIFDARNDDLGLPFKEHQFDKFKEHCEKYCINRRIMGLGLSFARVLDDMLRNNIDVSHLILSRNRLKDSGVQILARHLVTNKSVIHLDLSQNEISHLGAVSLFEALTHNESIISLDLGSYGGQYRNRLGAKGLSYLASILEMPNTLLSHIYLAGNYIGNNGVQLLAQGLKLNERVMDIDLTNNEISGSTGAEAIALILTNPPNRIQRLVLSKNPLGNSGINKLANALRHESCRIHSLSLKSCQFDHIGGKELFMAVKHSYFIKTLVLDKNKLTGAGTSTLQQMLWGNSQLVNLSMAACNIKDEGAISLFDGLERNIALKQLVLTQNQLTDKSIMILSKKALVIKLSLKLLDLSFNYITHKSGVVLMESLSNNDSMQALIINNNQLGDESAQELIQTLKKNKQLKKVNLNHNCINIRFINEINEFLEKNEMLALERVLPDFQREIKSMANDKRDYDLTCKDLLNTCINKAATINRTKLKEQEIENFKKQSLKTYQEQQHQGYLIQQKLRDMDHQREGMEFKTRDREKYQDRQERELKAFVINTVKEQKTVENDIEYYQNEIKQKRQVHEQKRSELAFELQEANRRMEVERRSYFTLLETLEQYKKTTQIEIKIPTEAGDERVATEGTHEGSEYVKQRTVLQRQSTKNIDFALERSNLKVIGKKKKGKKVIKKPIQQKKLSQQQQQQHQM